MSKNFRNRYSQKTIKAQIGEVEIMVTHDRNSECEPQIISKYKIYPSCVKNWEDNQTITSCKAMIHWAEIDISPLIYLN